MARTDPDPTPDPTWQPAHPLTPEHLRCAQIAAARVRRGMPTVTDPQMTHGGMTHRGKTGGGDPAAPSTWRAMHPRFCLCCGGRHDAEGFVAMLLARLGIAAPPDERPHLSQLVTGGGGRRRAEEEGKGSRRVADE